jgi:predicted O-methyltransferase YrrM
VSVASVPYSLPVRGLEELYPGIQGAEVRLSASHLSGCGDWSLPLRELFALATICSHMRPRCVYEIGTYTGAATLALAMNTPPDARIVTLELGERERAAWGGEAAMFSVGALYRGTPYEPKVHPLFGDSLTFDHSPYFDSMDLVLIDANHTYPFVRQDTESAFRLVRRGGAIIWDDYIWSPEHPECEGVTRCLNELACSRPIFQIRGTRLAIYREGVASAAQDRL